MNTSSALTQASQQAFAKLHPRLAFKNPVMLVVWVATLIAMLMTAQQLATGASFGFALASSVILFFTLWFANFAEAIAEARGRDQAASLKATRRDLTAVKLDSTGERRISASELKAGDNILVQAGELIPADGEIVIGVASINESALTGESAPVLREAGTDQSGVIAGTKLLSGTITVQVTAESGHSFLDKMIRLVEGTNRQKTPNELALTVLLSALTLVFLIAVATLPAMASFVDIELDWLMLIALVVCLIPTTIAGLLPAIGIAGMNRALTANVIAKSGKAVEVAGDIDTLLLDKTGTITFGDRQATAFLPLPGVAQAELTKSGVSHPVTAVLLNFRSWDTLLELVVLLLALLGALQVAPAVKSVTSWSLGLSWSRLLAPMVILLAGYLLWAGASQPGGAFQAGALLAAGAVVLRLNHQLNWLSWCNFWVRLLVVAGVAVFVLVALLALWLTPANADAVWLSWPPLLAGGIILLIEVFATLAIALTLTLLVVGEPAPQHNRTESV